MIARLLVAIAVISSAISCVGGISQVDAQAQVKSLSDLSNPTGRLPVIPAYRCP
jgi:hypothetical protein